MNTKIIMTSSAVMMGVAGLGLSFFPQEILHYANIDSVSFYPFILQITGSLYFAFAMLNWMAKESLIGGIYGKPIAAGNFTHFVIGALTLIKVISHQNGLFVWIAAITYFIFAVLFGLIMFRHPVEKSSSFS